MTPSTTPVTHELVRRWLVNLRRPDRLYDPGLRELLRAHGVDASAPALRTGRAAAGLLRDKIDALRPPDGAPSSEALPYRVLKTCFVDGAKSYQAAARLGLSERQLSRERSRAIALLADELYGSGRPGAVPPAASGPRLVPRPDLTARLDALAAGGRVHVTGAPGAGKTALVAEWAAGAANVFWHTFLSGVGAGLPSLLFDLGTHLAPEDDSLAAYLDAAGAEPDLGLASEIALAALRRAPRVLVLDDFDSASGDAAIAGFLDGAATRRPRSTVVTVGRRPARRGGACLAVPSLSAAETAALLALRGPAGDDGLAGRLHSWTRGNARLLDAAATWLTAGDGAALTSATAALAGAAGEDDAVVRTLATLMWSARRAA